MLQAKLQRSYKSKSGNTVFVYAISGDKESMEQFKTAQGTNHREDDHGVALWFTTRCIGKSGTLIITTTGKVVPDMSEYEMANSLAKQFGGNLGQEIARIQAENLMGTHRSATVPEAVVAPTASSVLED